MKCIFLILVLLAAMVPTCNAAHYTLNPIDVGAKMIATGIDQSMTNIADDMMGGFRSNTTTNATISDSPPSVTDLIKSFTTWSVSPFKYATVIKIMGISLCCAAVFLILYAILGAAYVAASRMSSRKMELFHHLMNTKSGHSAFQNYGQNVVIGCIAMTFMAWGVFMTLLLSKVLKMMIMDGITDAISPSLATVSVLYLAMTLMWVLVAVFFGISNIVICLTAALSFMLGAVYASDRTRHITVKWMDYFFGMVLMQVFVILVVAVAVGVIMDIKATPAGSLLFVSNPMAEFSMYLGLILFVLIGCAYFVLGKARVIKTGKRAIKLVL